MNAEKPDRFDESLDAKGLDCPLPLLKAKQALNRLSGGQILYVEATDQGSVRDFDAFARQSGNELCYSETNDGAYCFWLRKRA